MPLLKQGQKAKDVDSEKMAKYEGLVEDLMGEVKTMELICQVAKKHPDYQQSDSQFLLEYEELMGTIFTKVSFNLSFRKCLLRNLG